MRPFRINSAASFATLTMFVFLLPLVALPAGAFAQSDDKQTDDKQTDDKQTDDKAASEERAARMRLMRRLIQEVKVYKVTDDGRVLAKLVDDPLLRMSDMSRGRQDGALWTWGQTGRPCAVLQLWQNIFQEDWHYGFSSLSTGLIAADVEGQWQWRPRRPGLEFKAFPQVPAPPTGKAARLRQMKALARRFSSHQFWDPDNQRSELRVLPQPAHRYDEPESGVLDGTVFIIVHATDPEVILLIEVVQEDSSPARWQYGLARMGAAEFVVSFDGREVWHVPRVPGVLGSSTDPYWQFSRQVGSP